MDAPGFAMDMLTIAKPGVFIAFCLIKPAKINLSLFGRSSGEDCL